MSAVSISSLYSIINSGEMYSARATAWVETEPDIQKNKHISLWEKIVSFLSIANLTNKIESINKEITIRLPEIVKSLPECSKQDIIVRHTSLRKHLDTVDKYNNLENKLNLPPKAKSLAIQITKFISILKELEMQLRIAAYPEKNEIVLTYDELKELSVLMKGWEPADEQSDLYTL